MKTPAKILVVDDEPANVDILETRLSAHGYEIVTAADGAEALALVESERPDLILLDVQMPRIDGFEVCRRIQSRGAPLPVIFLTSNADDAHRREGTEAGATAYLSKPFSPIELLNSIQRTRGGG